MRRVYSGDLEDRWYYQIEVSAETMVNDIEATKDMRAIMLLDESLVLPRVNKN